MSLCQFCVLVWWWCFFCLICVAAVWALVSVCGCCVSCFSHFKVVLERFISSFNDEESEESRISQEWLCPSALPNYNRDFYYNIWDGVFRVDRLKSVLLQLEYKTTPATLFYRKTSLNSKWVTVLWSHRILIGCRSSSGSESDLNDDDGGSSCRVDLHCSQNHFWKRLFSRTCRSVYLFMLYIQLTLSMLMSPDGTDPMCVSPLRFSSGSVCICRYYRLTWWTARRHRAEYYFLLSLLRVVLLLLLRSAAGCCFKPSPWRNQTRH